MANRQERAKTRCPLSLQCWVLRLPIAGAAVRFTRQRGHWSKIGAASSETAPWGRYTIWGSGADHYAAIADRVHGAVIAADVQILENKF